MDQPPPSPTRQELDAIIKRQNQLAVRCMAVENVLRGMGAWLAAAMPERTAERMLAQLESVAAMQLDPGMPPQVVENLKALVANEQADIVRSLREEIVTRNGPRPYPADRG